MEEVTAQVQTEDTSQVQGNVLGLVAGLVSTKTYLPFVTTTDDQPTELSLDSLGADFIETEDHKAYFVTAEIVGTDVNGFRTAGFRRWCLVHRNVGVASVAFDNEGDSGSDLFLGTAGQTATIEADTATDGRIKIIVTGNIGETYKWAATVTVTETVASA
jgi:hypothetical protein